MLDALGLRPRHRFGQNFLHDAGKMEQIVAAARIAPGDVVLEVGPGTGALSIRLLAAGATLIAVEIDRDLEPILREQFAQHAGQAGAPPQLIVDDVLAGKHAINPRVLDALAATGASHFKLIANLPYHVASPLLANLLLLPYTDSHSAISPRPFKGQNPQSAIRNPQSAIVPRLSLAVVTIQREVADRLAASPGGKEYGPLGILVQALAEVDRVTTLPPGCFWPQPDVESAVARLRVREKPLTDDPTQLTQLLQTLFTKRRKQLGSILGRDVVLPVGVDAKQRPETLSVEQLIELARRLGG